MMVTHLIGLFAVGLAPQSKPADKLPDLTVPIAASSEFHQSVLEVERALAKGDFSGAASLQSTLPKAIFSYRVDWKNCPTDLRSEYEKAIVFAAKTWETRLAQPYRITEIKTGRPDLLFSFEAKLPQRSDSPVHAGAVWSFSPSASEPRLETVIGVSRGAPIVGTAPVDVFNEAVAAFGCYYGLEFRPLTQYAMGRQDFSAEAATTIQASESRAVIQNLRIANLLRIAIKEKKKIAIQEPNLFIEQRIMNFGSKVQGDDASVSFLVSNRGNSPLLLAAQGDCACISGAVKPILKPGESALLKGFYDTLELDGDVTHNLVLMTNDPHQPVIKIPATVHVDPIVQFLYPHGSGFDLDVDSGVQEVYVNLRESVKLELVGAFLSGINQEAKISTFNGEVKSILTGKSTSIKGLKLAFDLDKVEKKLVNGRIFGQIMIRTNHPKFRVLKSDLTFQKGIAVLPDQVYLGTPNGPSEAKFIVTRPRRPFKIVKISSTSKHLTFVPIPNPEQTQFRIMVKYDGKALEHRIDAALTIETDDAVQPILKARILTSGV